MPTFGFQRDDLQFAAAGFGGSDSGGFGAMPFGGSGYAVYEPPTLQSGSDDPTTDLRSSVGESVLERSGVVLAARVFAERRAWRLVYSGGKLNLSNVTDLRAFWRVRRFRLLPDSLDEATYWIVRWEDQEFDPKRLRGGQQLYNLSFNLVEVN